MAAWGMAVWFSSFGFDRDAVLPGCLEFRAEFRNIGQLAEAVSHQPHEGALTRNFGGHRHRCPVDQQVAVRLLKGLPSGCRMDFIPVRGQMGHVAMLMPFRLLSLRLLHRGRWSRSLRGWGWKRNRDRDWGGYRLRR